jgi:hypothetical protein
MCKSVKTFHRSFVQTRDQSRYSAVEESQVVLFLVLEDYKYYSRFQLLYLVVELIALFGH